MYIYFINCNLHCKELNKPFLRGANKCNHLSNISSRYAEEVESRLRSIGLVCNIGYPPPDVTPTEAVDRVARLGTLYAVVVAPQNTLHRSCTLNILHGTRQGRNTLAAIILS